MCIDSQSFRTGNLQANELSDRWIPLTGWQSAAGFRGPNAMDTIVQLWTVSPGFRCRFGLQTAEADTDVTDAPVAIGSYRSMEGKAFETVDCSAHTMGKGYVRFGVLVSSTSGNNGIVSANGHVQLNNKVC
ncbi:MAG: hypothetical protein AAFV53_27465 [Myxococcota bacterium]